jgi:acetylornithine deacetylase/succinyl-diaminopimelate desuccinylase-like protein
MDNELYRALVATARRFSPEAVISPFMMTGGSDSRYLRRRGVPCYGTNPCPSGEAESKTSHGHDERVRAESVGVGLRFVGDVVMAACR